MRASSPGGRLPTRYSTIAPVPINRPILERLNSCNVNTRAILVSFHQFRRSHLSGGFSIVANIESLGTRGKMTRADQRQRSTSVKEFPPAGGTQIAIAELRCNLSTSFT